MAGVQVILMALAEIGILIYPRGWFSVSQIHQSCRTRKTNENAKAMGRDFAGVHQRWQQRHKVLRERVPAGGSR